MHRDLHMLQAFSLQTLDFFMPGSFQLSSINYMMFYCNLTLRKLVYNSSKFFYVILAECCRLKHPSCIQHEPTLLNQGYSVVTNFDLGMLHCKNKIFAHRNL